VARAGDDRYPVKDGVIRSNLGGEPSQLVVIALYLIAQEPSVDDRNVSTGGAVMQAKLVYNSSVVAPAAMP
jgi:hypothetical protein